MALRNVTFALRFLLRTPAFTCAAVLPLTFGLAAATAVFGFVNGLLLKPLRVPNASELVRVSLVSEHGEHPNGNPRGRGRAACPVGALYTSLGQVSGWGGGQVTGRWQTSTRRLSAELVVGSYFDALGVRAVSGRLLMRSDDEPSAPPTVVISERLWRSWMAAADDVVGGTLHVAGQQMTIVGLAPKSFRGVRWSHVQTTDVWFPSR